MAGGEMNLELLRRMYQQIRDGQLRNHCHRRDGLALWRYRGEHRDRPLRVHIIRLAVLAQDEARRRAHLRSLRRPFDPGPIFVGTRLLNVRFYGVVPGSDMVAGLHGTLEWTQPDDVATLPAITQALEPAADEAPTGPILMGETA